MKMTMHINEELLKSVMRNYDISSKTEAVEMALMEVNRRAALRSYATKGLGFAPDVLRDAVDPDYNVAALRNALPASGSVTYGKRRTR